MDEHRANGTTTADQQERLDPAADFAPPFPWFTGVTEEHLSTKRGFVFQYPPFPAIGRGTEGVVHAPLPAGLYVHVPFCPYHCAFCYYAISLRREPEDVARYLAALELELELSSKRPVIQHHIINTVFIGGGTPTFLNERELNRLDRALQANFDLGTVTEFTVEADPTTLSLEKVYALRSLGVNRLSIGVQSFSSDINLLNDRKHTEQQSLAAIAIARQGGIANLNLDLI